MESGEDVVMGLLKLCNDDPEAGLEALDSLPVDLRNNDVLLAARLVALHLRAVRSLLTVPHSIFDLEDAELQGLLGSSTRGFVQEAFEQAVDLIQRDEDYALNNPTVGRVVDNALNLHERLNPGEVQAALGWTKLHYFGTTRLGPLKGTTAERASNTDGYKIPEIRIRPPEIVRSGLIVSASREANGNWKSIFLLMQQDFNRYPTFGDAGSKWTLSISADGNAEFRSGVDDNLLPDLETAQRQKEADETEAKSAILDDILDTCESEPEECLAKIGALDQTLRNEPGAMFSRFLALRQLALAKFYAAPHEATKGSYVDISPFFTPQHLDHAEAALHQVADIERIHPGYLDSLGTPDDRFAIVRVDGLGDILELMRPGKVQEILGWIKLKFLPSDRLKALPGFSDKAPKALQTAIMNVKFAPPEIVASGLALYVTDEPGGVRSITYHLCREDFNGRKNLLDAGLFGTAKVFENGRVDFTPDGAKEAIGIGRNETTQDAQDKVMPVAEQSDVPPSPLAHPAAFGAPYRSSEGLKPATIRLMIGCVFAAFLAVGAFIVIPHNAWPSLSRSEVSQAESPVTQYVTRPAIMRNAPTTVGSQQIAMLSRGTELQGTWVTGTNTAAQWLRITTGPYSGDFLSGVNLSSNSRPNIIRVIEADTVVEQRSDLLAFPAAVDSVLTTVEAGTTVHAAAEVEGGWIEIQRKLGGVGYLPGSAFVKPQQGLASVASAPNLPNFQTSFDCARATKWAELQVCHTANLAEQDRRIAERYVMLMRSASASDRVDLRQAQRTWIVSRDQCENQGGPTCLSQLYAARMSALESWTSTSNSPAGASQPSSTLPTTAAPVTTETFNCVKNDNPNVHATFFVDYANRIVRSPNFGAIGQNLAARISDSTISWHAREVRNYGFGGFIDQDMTIDKATGTLADNYGDGTTYFSCRTN